MLEVDAITAGYGGVPIIADVSLRAKPGQIVSVLGPNGSGKSTLLKAIIGLIKPLGGHAILDNNEFTDKDAYATARLGVGYVPQSNNVFPSLTVIENLEMGGYMLRGGLTSQLNHILDRFPDLAAAKTKRAGHLSGGQRNLLGIARALMSNPRAILVDEPSAGLAPGNIDIIWSELVEIAGAGAAVVVVEQNVDVALKHSHWSYILVGGRNALDGSAAGLRTRDLHSVFLGEKGGEDAVPGDVPANGRG